MIIEYYNEAVRLLLEICILLLKAKREEIMVDELNEVSFNAFGIKATAESLNKLGFGNTFEWNKETQKYAKIRLKYPIEMYEAVLEKIENKELAYIPEELFEKDFRDSIIRGKVIWGIGQKAICLVDKVEYHEECAHPRTAMGIKKFINYKRNKMEAEKLAKEILAEHGGK